MTGPPRVATACRWMGITTFSPPLWAGCAPNVPSLAYFVHSGTTGRPGRRLAGLRWVSAPQASPEEPQGQLLTPDWDDATVSVLFAAPAATVTWAPVTLSP